MWFVENYDGFSENVRKCSKNHHFEGKYFFKFMFSKSKFIEFSKFQNLTFLKLGESYDSAIFYEQTDRKILVLQANVPDVRQATQEPWNPTMLRNLTLKGKVWRWLIRSDFGWNFKGFPHNHDQIFGEALDKML